MPVIYSMSVSADGYINDRDRDFNWSPPDDELFAFHNEQVGGLDAYVLGRRLYEDMLVWETAEETMSEEVHLEFGRIWRALERVVFSRTLQSVEGDARLATDDLRTELSRLRSDERQVSIAGATLASAAIAEDLVDEYRLFVYPIILGGGTPFFPPLAKSLDLRLIESRTISQVAFMRYERER